MRFHESQSAGAPGGAAQLFLRNGVSARAVRGDRDQLEETEGFCKGRDSTPPSTMPNFKGTGYLPLEGQAG